jgi:preprotein translocase subunit YajC
MFISNAYAQTAGAATDASAGGTLMSMLPLLLMFVVLYFVMIRPQMRKAKEHKLMIEALVKGDEVATAGGLLGKVTKLGEGQVSVEIATGVEVQLQRSAVIQVLPKGSLK